MYINDDDLAKQFSKPNYRKDSRLFSVGSVSTIGPLDVPGVTTHVEDVEEKASGAEKIKEGAEVRARAAFDQTTTPADTLQPPSTGRRSTHACVRGHRLSSSLDTAGKRKMSLASLRGKGQREGSVVGK